MIKLGEDISEEMVDVEFMIDELGFQFSDDITYSFLFTDRYAREPRALLRYIRSIQDVMKGFYD